MVATIHDSLINHVGFACDMSSSMQGRPAQELVKVMDGQVKHLATRSTQLDQETRATVYTFNTRVVNVYYDKDVLRLPSIAQHYNPSGYTALIDATLQMIEDMQKTATLYGDHAFLLYVLTDGEENSSRNAARTLSAKIQSLPKNWTLACLVPNAVSVHEAKQFGFLPENIAVWNADSAQGVQEVGETIRRATDNFMTARATRTFSGTSNLFTLDVNNLNPQTVSTANLHKLARHQFRLFDVPQKMAIAPFVEGMGIPYRLGSAYYELSKKETIQPQKAIAIYDLGDKSVFTGSDARKLLGLPDYEIKVNPADHAGRYKIFVQSTSVNRNLMPNTQLLLLS